LACIYYLLLLGSSLSGFLVRTDVVVALALAIANTVALGTLACTSVALALVLPGVALGRKTKAASLACLTTLLRMTSAPANNTNDISFTLVCRMGVAVALGAGSAAIFEVTQHVALGTNVMLVTTINSVSNKIVVKSIIAASLTPVAATMSFIVAIGSTNVTDQKLETPDASIRMIGCMSLAVAMVTAQSLLGRRRSLLGRRRSLLGRRSTRRRQRTNI
jgi:hypothetical protein